MPKIAVLAGNRREFERWLSDNGMTDREALHAFEPRVILGSEISRIEVTGTFWYRKDATELHDLAKSRVR